MNAAAAIASLDRQLAAHGQSVTLKRGAPAAPDNSATVNAFVRGKRRDELAGGASQEVRTVVLSPTGLAAASWPDQPKKDDWLTVEGRDRIVLEAERILFGGTAIRHELKIKG